MTSAEESTTTVQPLRPRKNMLIYDINFHCVLRRKFIAYLVLYPKRAITTHLGDWSQLVKIRPLLFRLIFNLCRFVF